MHIGIFENTVIGLFTDQALILVLPTFPAGLGVEDPVSFFKTSPRDLCQKPFAQLSRSAHDNEERSCTKKEIDLFPKIAFDIGIIPQRHPVGNCRSDLQPIVLQHLHQRTAAVGKAIEDIHLAAVILYKIIFQTLCLIGQRLKFRLRFGRVEAVVGKQYDIFSLPAQTAPGTSLQVPHGPGL